jgi:PAS domain S-box-containing protein
MENKDYQFKRAAEILRQAEEIARIKIKMVPENLEALSPEETGQILHKLHAHQIDLETQNEELRRSQAELEADRAHYFDFYNLATVGFCSTCKQGLIIETNLTTATMLGVAVAQLINQPFTRFIHKEDLDNYYLHGKQIVETGLPQAFDLRMVKNDGASFWTHLTATAAQDTDGTHMCRIVISDITDRKQAEEIIQDSEQRFRAAFMGSPAAVCITTLQDGVWTDANQAELDLFGYTREEVIGKSALETNLWVDPNDRQRIVDTLNRGEGVRNQHILLRHKDGNVISTSVSSTALTLKGKRHILYVTEDISERKQIEAALRESDAKHRLLFENANDAIFIVDMEARILTANPMAVRQLGYTHAELTSMTIYQVDSPEGGNRVQERMARLMEQGHLTFETVHLRKDGSPIPIEISARRITWDGKTAIMSICRNISERKIADETRKASLHEKEVLLREIHHRVKNNMQVISSLLQLKAMRVKNEQARQALLESQQRIIAMAKIHETLYSSHNLAMIDFSVYLKSLIQHIQGAYSTQADIRIALELDKVELDINQAVPCSLILNELITNALKHAFPAGNTGTIRIKLHLINDREVLLEVSDDGIGLSTDLDLVNPPSLGMMLVQRLLKKQLKGSLNMVSEGGTSFTLRWPLSDIPFLSGPDTSLCRT